MNAQNNTMENGVAVVTGGSAGIGASISRHLLDAGHTVLNLSRRGSGFEHERLIDVPVDLSDTGATRQVADELSRQYDITTVVHNAGVIRPSLIEDVDLEDVDYITRLHLHAGIILVQAALPAMKAAGFGRVVVVGSRAMLGLQTRTGYAATKAGQVGMVRTWALELGPHGVTANVVAPGPIVTDMFTEVIPEDSDKARALAESIPVRRLGQADDVARAVMFLVSPGSGFVTGQTLFVCGGTSVGSLSL
ncbi:SDR family NAD(P)-dependent oxidoreductase [Elongatibacter sediminis]|uniref:SDR family oxidoreductase n=1 Tax=Elongatibacter sediminis TaxID=3119006 RepID=A0AAW9R9B9_9GAMM